MSWRVWAVVAVAAAAGAAAGTHPAGWRPADVVLTAAFAAVVTIAGAHSRRWAWLVVSGVAVLSAASGLALVGAIAALTVALVCALFDRESRFEGAVVAGLAVQALLRMRDFGFHGAPSAAAAAAVIPLLLSGYRAAPPATRHTARRVTLALGLVVFVCLGLAVWAGIRARNDIQRGIREAKAGFDAVQNGDRDTAVVQLSEAEASFRGVSDAVDAWWVRPVRAVPFAGQQMAAAQAMADEGGALAHAGSTGVATIDYDQLRLQGGAIDLDRLQAAQQPLSETVDALDHADRRLATVADDWLVPPLRDRYDEMQGDIAKSLPSARTARDVVALGPSLLGRDGPKHYVVLFGTPSETRELGGLIGNYAEVTADHGKLTLTRSGRSVDLSNRNGRTGATLPPGPLADRYALFDVTTFFQNVSASPDFSEVAAVTEDIYPQVFDEPVDGVFYMDPYTLAALLALTGPVTLPTSGVTLDAGNAAQTLMVDQYVNAPNTADRVDFLDEATRLTFEKLTSGDLPKPSRVATVLDPMVEQGRLLGSSPNPDVERLFRELALDGAFPNPQGGDFFSVTQSNLGMNKIDAYLKRSVTYRATYRPDTGEVDSTLSVQLANSAPADGLPDIVLANPHGLPRGTNQARLIVNSALGLTGATIGGQNVAFGSGQRFGVNSYTFEVDVPPGETQTLEVHLRGTITPSAEYHLTVARQPTYDADDTQVDLAGSGGWVVASSPEFHVEAGTGTATVGTDRIENLTARFARTG